NFASDANGSHSPVKFARLSWGALTGGERFMRLVRKQMPPACLYLLMFSLPPALGGCQRRPNRISLTLPFRPKEPLPQRECYVVDLRLGGGSHGQAWRSRCGGF